MQDLIVLAFIVAVWWLPTLRVIREMDLLPGLPRPLFWSVLPVIGLPLIGLVELLGQFGVEIPGPA